MQVRILPAAHSGCLVVVTPGTRWAFQGSERKGEKEREREKEKEKEKEKEREREREGGGREGGGEEGGERRRDAETQHERQSSRQKWEGREGVRDGRHGSTSTRGRPDLGCAGAQGQHAVHVERRQASRGDLASVPRACCRSTGPFLAPWVARARAAGRRRITFLIFRCLKITECRLDFGPRGATIANPESFRLPHRSSP